MEELKDLTREKLLEYCVDKKLKGVSFREFSNIFEKAQVDSDTRRFIMNELDKIDKVQKEINVKDEKLGNKLGGVIYILIGAFVFLLGIFLYSSTKKVGVIFVFNFIVWGAGLVLIFRGLMKIIAGFVRKD